MGPGIKSRDDTEFWQCLQTHSVSPRDLIPGSIFAFITDTDSDFSHAPR